MNFQPAVKDVSVLVENDMAKLVLFYEQELASARAALTTVRMGGRVAVKKLTWPAIVEAPVATAAPSPPTVRDLELREVQQLADLRRTRRDLEIALDLSGAAVRQVKAQLADLEQFSAELKREEDERPRREWEEKRRRDQEECEIARLERSSDWRDWGRAKEIRDRRVRL